MFQLRKILFLGIFVTILVSAYLYKRSYSLIQPITSIGTKIVNEVILTPTPIPFYDLTIPSLRVRNYESRIGDLVKAYERENYTAYTTSYDSEGLRINGLLTKPSGVMPQGGWPAVVFVHGYIPPKEYQTLEKYNDYVDFLARNGLVVFKIDLRGHGSSGGESSGAYYSSDYIVDVLSAYKALQNSGFVNKIGLWGHSMSGNVVLRSMASMPSIPAVVIWSGAVYSYTDFAKYSISDSSYQPPQMSSERVRKRQQLLSLYGEPSENSSFWKQVAATNYLDDLKGAIQIHHAVDDPVVKIGYSRDLMAFLDKTHVPHELYEYPSGGHNLTGSSFTQAMQRTVDFYKKNL